jgi:hypothetical protein
MNWYNLFYWITRADSVKDFFDTASNIFTWLSIIAFIGMVICSIGSAVQISESNSKNDEEDKSDSDIRAWQKTRLYISYLFYPLLILSLITWAGYVFVPTKKEALIIMAAGGTMQYFTTDSTAKQIPHEMTTFVVTELKSMAKEAQVDLGIASQKDKILDEAKKMTTTELLEKMRVDSNFAKIVTDR